ncbi:hypothetical protein [Halosolutus halophilus]|nr:hypothetical protein [Halosolutus halophilus]
MNELVLPLAAETPLPIGLVGWGTLLLGLLVAVVWLIYLYR